MDSRLVVLKLFLDELGVPSDIETVDDRKRVQKAVYLGQLSGVDLSYRFGWYLMGPYSPSLTNDYYTLAESIASGNEGFEGKRLHKSVKEHLQKIVPLMKVPKDVELPQEGWLELLSSLHFLREVRKADRDSALEVLKKDKKLLSPFADKAEKQLQETSLLT